MDLLDRAEAREHSELMGLMRHAQHADKKSYEKMAKALKKQFE